MDWIRVPYRSLMRLHADDLGQLTPVQWYPAPPGALTFPYETPFCSRMWDGELGGAQILGEDPATIRYHAGRDIPPTAGRWFCGNPRQWLEGASVTDPLPRVNVQTNLPCCCGRAPYLATGGLILSGRMPPPSHDCPAFPLGHWLTYRITVAGVIDDPILDGNPECPLFNGTWNLTYIGVCRWRTWEPEILPDGSAGWEMSVDFLGRLQLLACYNPTAFGTSVYAQWRSLGPIDIRGFFDLPFVFQEAACVDYPLHVTVNPLTVEV
jgi:hypothetical protein